MKEVMASYLRTTGTGGVYSVILMLAHTDKDCPFHVMERRGLVEQTSRHSIREGATGRFRILVEADLNSL